MTNLNSLLPSNLGWTLQEALGINDLQKIVAVGVGPNSPGEQHAVVLSPEFPGDANLDGKVDINDLTVVLSHFDESKQTWTAGDFNGDHQVDINDLTIVLANYGQTIGCRPGARFPPCRSPARWFCWPRVCWVVSAMPGGNGKLRNRESQVLGFCSLRGSG